MEVKVNKRISNMFIRKEWVNNKTKTTVYKTVFRPILIFVTCTRKLSFNVTSEK